MLFLIFPLSYIFCFDLEPSRLNLLPKPKSVIWGDKTFSLDEKYVVILPSEEEKFGTTIRRLKNFLKAEGIIRVEIKDRLYELSKVPSIIFVGRHEEKKLKDFGLNFELIEEGADNISRQGYSLIITKNGGGSLCVILYGAGKAGTFYALSTFKQMMYKNKEDGKIYLKEVKVKDYPSFLLRGVIEGGGGNWKWDDRLRMFDFYADVKMNGYLYGPKGDKKLRDEWLNPYSDEELAKFSEMINKAKDNFVQFSMVLSPAMSFNFTDEEDFKRLADKYLKIQSLGCKRFSLFFDDIFPSLSTKEEYEMYGFPAYAHVDIANKIYGILKKNDPEVVFSFTPTQYWGIEASRYLTAVREKLHPDIYVGWTGTEVCSREITVNQTQEFINLVNHRVGIGDNFPVHGGGIATGPLRDRDKDLYKYVDAFLANPLWFLPETSKISLMTIADYTWNPEGYNPDESWETALKIFSENDEKVYDAIKAFAEQYQAAWAVKARPSPLMIKMDKFWNDYVDGREFKKSEDDLKAELNRVEGAGEIIYNYFPNKYFIKEAKKYIDGIKNYANTGRLLLDMVDALPYPSNFESRNKIRERFYKILENSNPDIKRGRTSVF